MSIPVPRYHGIDVVNLNALVADIRERLSGGLSGDFYEKGGAIKEGSRHAQLPLLFNAMNKIENLISSIEKQATITKADSNKEIHKPGGKPNKSMMATIKEMVHAEVELKTRTVTIESERLKEAMRKLEKGNAKLVDEVASVKSKLKKSGGQSASGSDDKYHAVSKKVEGMQKIQKQHDAGHSALVRGLETLRGAPTRASEHFQPDPGQDAPSVFGLSERIDDLRADLLARDSKLSKACDDKVSAMKEELFPNMEGLEFGEEVDEDDDYDGRFGETGGWWESG